MDQHPSVNNLYLSERLQKTLAGVGSHTVTTVIAPMGYGKSTALKWWQQQLAARIPHAKIFRQLVAADSRQDFWDGFCRTLRRWPTLAAQLRARGQTTFTETIFENRFGYVRELRKLGAQLQQDENTVCLHGTPQLHAAQLFAEDLRGGAALVLAAMQAEGESTIFGVKHIERGYDTLEAALQSVGARLKTVEIPKKM